MGPRFFGLCSRLTQLPDAMGFFLQMMTVALCPMILLYIIATPSALDKRASHRAGNA